MNEYLINNDKTEYTSVKYIFKTLFKSINKLSYINYEFDKVYNEYVINNLDFIISFIEK